MKLFHQPIFVIIIYAFVLLGCGQKGPLTLPEKQAPVVIVKQDNASKEPVNPQQEDKSNNAITQDNASTNSSVNNEATPQ